MPSVYAIPDLGGAFQAAFNLPGYVENKLPNTQWMHPPPSIDDMALTDGNAACLTKGPEAFLLQTQPIPDDCFPGPEDGSSVRQSGLSMPLQVGMAFSYMR